MKLNTSALLRFLRRTLVAAVAAVAFWTILLMLFEEKFIFFPSAYPDGFYGEAANSPSLEDCWFTSEDGVKLHAWFAKADSPIATLLMAHGNAGNLSHRYPVIKALRDAGFNVLMFDYRGYGRSEGSPTEEGIYADARAAFDYLRQRKDVDSASMIMFGTSLGGAVAVDLATHRPVAGLVLEATFSSAKDVARVAYPFLPAQFILRTRLDSESKIRTLHLPVLFIHGDVDGIIPISLGRKLYAAANEPKQFYLISGAGHNDTFWVGAQEYLDTISSFVRKTQQ